MRTISMFANLGGAPMGLTASGDEMLWGCETDPDAVGLLRSSFSFPMRQDITSIHPRDIPHADVAFVGIPNWPHDAAARTARSLLSVVLPRAIIVDFRDQFWLRCFDPCLTTMGYKSVHYDGYAVSLRKDVVLKTFEFPFPDRIKESRKLDSVLEAEPSDKLRFPADKPHQQVFSPSDPCPMLTLRHIKNPYGSVVEDEKGLRLFSPLECARMIGLPDTLVPACSRTRAYRLVLQTPPPRLIRDIADELKVWL